MSSVTGRIKEIKQPRGGYIKPSDFEEIKVNDSRELAPEENVHSSIVGMAVDYLTRFMINANKGRTFAVSLLGAKHAQEVRNDNSVELVKSLLNDIKGLDDKSIISACKVVTFDVWFRNPLAAMMAKGHSETNPDEATIENIRTLVNRSVEFFEKYGPVVSDGFSFEPVEKDESVYETMMTTGNGSYGGYTATVSAGDGDFLTEDTLWDFKVSKSKPTNQHTLQLLMYWIMGQHSGQAVYKNITRLGVFNPRLNTIYLLNMSQVPKDVIKTVEDEVICY